MTRNQWKWRKIQTKMKFLRFGSKRSRKSESKPNDSNRTQGLISLTNLLRSCLKGIELKKGPLLDNKSLLRGRGESCENYHRKEQAKNLKMATRATRATKATRATGSSKKTVRSLQNLKMATKATRATLRKTTSSKES